MSIVATFETRRGEVRAPPASRGREKLPRKIAEPEVWLTSRALLRTSSGAPQDVSSAARGVEHHEDMLADFDIEHGSVRDPPGGGLPCCVIASTDAPARCVPPCGSCASS